MMTAINNLREVQRRCLNYQSLDPDLADWLAQSLQAFLSRQCNSVDIAFGLSAPKGGIPWWLEEGIRARNKAIRDLANFACPGQSPTAQARKVHKLSVRYAATRWRQDRFRKEMPDWYPGTTKEFLWRAFRAGATMPVSERHLRGILGK